MVALITTITRSSFCGTRILVITEQSGHGGGGRRGRCGRRGTCSRSGVPGVRANSTHHRALNSQFRPYHGMKALVFAIALLT